MSGGVPFQFHTNGIEEWVGRYCRIPGDLSVFKVVFTGGRYVIQAFIETVEGRVTFETAQTQGTEQLISAINAVKWRYNHQPGGSFVVNEYGQVLVPTRAGKRFCVGKITGVMLLRNVDTQEIVDLSDDAGLRPGDPWDLPYVGLAYRLSCRSQIYYWDKTNGRSIKPHTQDWDLIHQLRTVRRYGAVRFLVNPYGLVLTKIPKGAFDPDGDQWQPVYVGRIDYDKWFMEEGLKNVGGFRKVRRQLP
jgi:hypothetical protein